MKPHRALGSWSRPVRRALLRVWPLAALLVLAAFCLAPALGTGYWAEDVYYSAMIPANPILHGSTWITETLREVRHSMMVGRFYPITPVITAVAFTLFPKVVWYKGYIIAVTLLDVALFTALVRRLTGRRSFAVLAGMSVVALFQFRLTVDPILAYYGQIQWVTAFFLMSLIWLRRSLETGSTTWLTASAGCYLLCTLAYEMTYTLAAIPVFLIIQARPGFRAGVALARPYVAAAGFSAGMTILIRWLHPSDNYVHNTDFGPIAALQAFGNQVSAGLPLSYYFGDPLDLFTQGRNLETWVDWLLQPGVILVGLATIGLSFRNLRKTRRTSAGDLGPVSDRTLAGLGVLLATCPAILTAISPFHRNYISFGVGWIGVMVQYYGIALLLALGIWRLVATRGAGGPFARWKCLVASATLASVLGITYRANIEVATALNAPPGSDRYRQFVGNHGASWHLHRMNLVAAIDAGVMSEVPSGSRVQLVHLYPLWHDSLYGQFFYTKQTGKLIETVPTQLPTQLPPVTPVFRIRDVLRDRKTGFVVVTPAEVEPDQASTKGQLTGRVFVRHPALRGQGDQGRTMLLVGQSTMCQTAGESPIPRIIQLGRDLPVLQTGPGWALYQLDLPALAVDPDSLRLVDDPIQVAFWLESSSRVEASLATHPDGVIAR